MSSDASFSRVTGHKILLQVTAFIGWQPVSMWQYTCCVTTSWSTTHHVGATNKPAVAAAALGLPVSGTPTCKCSLRNTGYAVVRHSTLPCTQSVLVLSFVLRNQMHEDGAVEGESSSAIGKSMRGRLIAIRR